MQPSKGVNAGFCPVATFIGFPNCIGNMMRKECPNKDRGILGPEVCVVLEYG